MNTIKHLTLFSFLLSFALLSCSSPTKLAETGNYDSAIQRAVNKLAGKKNKKYKDVAALEDAFMKANAASLREIEEMKALERENLWPQILRTVDEIAYRQQIVEPLLPLVAENGYKAGFQFVRIEKIRPEAVDRTIAYYFDRAMEDLERGRNGDKVAAQNAYAGFQDVLNLDPSYRNAYDRKEEARVLGITHIGINFENRSNIFLPNRFAQDLLQVSTGDLNSTWRHFYTSPTQDIPLDYTVIVLLDRIDFTPDYMREHEYHAEKEVVDGFRIKKDRDGNPVLDSLGNQIRIPKKINVKADVLEIYKSKSAKLEGSMEFYDNRTGSLLDVQRIGAEVLFENVFGHFLGDKRALEKETLELMDNQNLPFPSEGDMILQAADMLRPVMCDRIRGFRFYS